MGHTTYKELVIYKEATGAVQLVPQQITSVRIVCAYISNIKDCVTESDFVNICVGIRSEQE